MLARLAHVVHGHRKLVVGLWIFLTAFGVFATMRVSNRWFESFSIPGLDSLSAANIHAQFCVGSMH